MSSNVKPSSSAPVLRPLNDEVSSDSPVFTLTRSSRSHVTMSTSPSGYENATCGVDLYEPSSYNSESSNGWYATKSSAAPLYVDRQPAPVDVEANLSDSKFDDVPPSQHDVDLTTVFVPHMVLSCLALWCCGCFLGCFGFLFAVASARYENQGNSRKAKVLSYISFSLSLLGFITGITAIVLLILSSFGVV